MISKCLKCGKNINPLEKVWYKLSNYLNNSFQCPYCNTPLTVPFLGKIVKFVLTWTVCGVLVLFAMKYVFISFDVGQKYLFFAICSYIIIHTIVLVKYAYSKSAFAVKQGH